MRKYLLLALLVLSAANIHAGDNEKIRQLEEKTARLEQAVETLTKQNMVQYANNIVQDIYGELLDAKLKLAVLTPANNQAETRECIKRVKAIQARYDKAGSILSVMMDLAPGEPVKKYDKFLKQIFSIYSLP